MRHSHVLTTATLIALFCAPGAVLSGGGDWDSGDWYSDGSKRAVCYEQRDGDIALKLVLDSSAKLTSWRSIYQGATQQTSYNAHGKIVNDDDTILPIDGSVLVGDGKNVPEGSYMNLETGKVQLECVAEEPSSTPATWTCVPSTTDGNKAIIETFDRVEGESDRCDTFAAAVIPVTSHPVEQPADPVLPPDVPQGDPATCTTCSMLACLLSPTNGPCDSSAEVCITTVVDQSAGREITRGCRDFSAAASQSSNDPQCDDIETRVLSSGVTCRYFCDGKTHPNCNKPPQLLPIPSTLIDFDNPPPAYGGS